MGVITALYWFHATTYTHAGLVHLETHTNPMIYSTIKY